MSVILYDLFLVMFGLILGIIVKDPLFKIFTGKYKEEARQKKRVKLLVYIRKHGANVGPTTEELAQKVFSNKVDTETVKQLLKDIEDTGLIKRVGHKGQDELKTRWVFTDKKY
ncbi:hypothetical protein [Alkalihalobacterium chitinilyticum]|uniref:MarR family transcriptional regulator n=1 Tax=Alkalihalobacterium chitinilyticum TaxID=2980103 RepID=A0ABT5VI66_9BACI|nr:hypothetical protein [Alkalihalobacterium chitinilyticum]MDE5415144.1 hypothetical protein [Alkalihalobacterium chitinilyticum]